jgi:hypothetical protein
MGDTRKHIHLVVDSELWKLFKIEAIRGGVSMTRLLEDLIRERLGESEEKGGRGVFVNYETEVKKPEVLKRESTPYDDLKGLYNLVARESREDGLPGFKTCRRLDDARKRRLKKRWGERDGWNRDMDRVARYFRKCCMERHWRGDNARGWRADIEFLTRETTVSKAIELEPVLAPVEQVDPTVAVEQAKSIIRKHVEAEEQVSEEHFTRLLLEHIKQHRLDAQRESLLQYLSSYETYFTTKGGVS